MTAEPRLRPASLEDAQRIAALSEVLGYLESERRCEILGLVVDPLQRGTGVGRQLVAQVERWAAARGLHMMTVRSNVLRHESHPFYEHVGYERTKTQHAYRKRLAD
jgi:GNAT superfamily N-acetyltransferase